MTQFASIGHIALRCRDIETSLGFYTQRLGMLEMLRLFYDDGSLFLIYLRITDDQFLELFPDGTGERAPGREAVAINHLCLTVTDIERTIADLAAAGVPLTRPLKLGVDGNHQAWIDDPDGNRIELMQMGANSLQVQALARLREGQGPLAVTTITPRPA